jgi:hypothetical protein
MAAQLQQPSAETVRKVAEQALADAVEITLLIALIQGQNTGGVNDQLSKAGAGRAARPTSTMRCGWPNCWRMV